MFGVIPEMVSCPQCGMPAVLKNYHVSHEEEVLCDYCGYTHIRTLSGKKIQKGYGCIHRAKKDGDEVTTVRIKAPLSLLGKNNIVKDIYANYDADRSAFYVWNDSNGIEAIIGAKPMTLEQYYEQQRQEAEREMHLMHACHPDDFL